MKTKGMKMSAINALADKGTAATAKASESVKTAEKAEAKKSKDVKECHKKGRQLTAVFEKFQ